MGPEQLATRVVVIASRDAIALPLAIPADSVSGMEACHDPAETLLGRCNFDSFETRTIAATATVPNHRGDRAARLKRASSAGGH